MPLVNPSPFSSKPTFFDPLTGAIANGYQLFAYLAGSVNTKQATYTDSTGTVANTNPIILNSAGEPSTQLWFTQGQAYKLILATPTDSDPPTNGFVLGDFLRGINDGSASAVSSQWLAGPAPSFINGTTFSLSGDQTSNFQVNRRVQTTNAGGTVYGTITASVFAAGVTTVTILPDSGALDAGISAVNYGLISSINTSDPFSTPLVDVQIFTASGTWTKPVTSTNRPAKVVEVICISGGGPGGGGRGSAAGADRGGGGAGGGGNIASGTFTASDLTATVAVTVATATTGGTGGGNANGTAGTVAGNSSFGAFLTAFGGMGGDGGTAGAGADGGGGGGTGGPGGVGSILTGGKPNTGAGSGSSNLSGAGANGGLIGGTAPGGNAEYGGAGGGGGYSSGVNAGAGGSSIYGAGAGGGGGGVTAANAETAGAAGGVSGSFTGGTGGAGGVVNGGAGGVGPTGAGLVLGGGGGGGGGQDSGTGGAGGNGGAPGGGGGGGGGGTNTGGAGGNGARGEVRVYSYF